MALYLTHTFFLMFFIMFFLLISSASSLTNTTAIIFTRHRIARRITGARFPTVWEVSEVSRLLPLAIFGRASVKGAFTKMLRRTQKRAFLCRVRWEKYPNVTAAEVDLIQFGEQSVVLAQSCGPQEVSHTQLQKHLTRENCLHTGNMRSSFSRT